MTKFGRSKFARFKPSEKLDELSAADLTIREIGSDLIENDACIEGTKGSFSRLDDDFASDLGGQDAGGFKDESHWTPAKREQVKKFRFVVCLLALAGLALSLMSRMILNVAIVEMVRSKPEVIVVEHSSDLNLTAERPGYLTSNLTLQELDTMNRTSEIISNSTAAIVLEDETGGDDNNNNETDPLHFDWSKAEVNSVLASFYAGYAPGILLSGGLSDKYGSKYPLFICVAGTSLINLLTPMIAQVSFSMLVCSRILLGLIQGSLIPALYDLFNKWLTPTESSIFAPMIKVSMPMGSLMGTLMPGIMASLGYEWPVLFYAGSFLCLLWSFAWFPLASSLPQTNKFVEPNELARIMRKKPKPAIVSVVTVAPAKLESRAKAKFFEAKGIQSAPTKDMSTPWLLIITSPSVIALTLVKFTYNMGMDFFYLELAVYLREMHDASIETISAIASGGYFMQMTLITFVGWMARNLVRKQALGLSVTKWRKVFQGSANFAMALVYFMLPVAGSNLPAVTCLILIIWFAWMLGAGGESMVPYDLSSKYPAAIVGLAHSISVFSGLTIPSICSLVLGENTDDPDRWSSLFYIIGFALALGGLAFILMLKAKPFIPEEICPKTKKKNSMAAQIGMTLASSR